MDLSLCIYLFQLLFAKQIGGMRTTHLSAGCYLTKQMYTGVDTHHWEFNTNATTAGNEDTYSRGLISLPSTHCR